MNFAEVEKEINNLAKKASDGSISIDEMAGGTFTISNGGVYGSLLSTPIINPPQVRSSMPFNFLILLLHTCTYLISLINQSVLEIIAVCYPGYALDSEPSNGGWRKHSSKADDVHCTNVRSQAD